MALKYRKKAVFLTFKIRCSRTKNLDALMNRWAGINSLCQII